MADSKTQRLVEAAKTRMKAERELSEKNSETPYENDEAVERVEEGQKEAAEKMAEVKVQPRAHTVDGEIDVEAMGDVKGDGGDAKDYADDDPDKALGVPVYKHGLHETTVTGEKFAQSKTLFGDRISPRTKAEMERGKKSLEGTKVSRNSETRRASSTRTTVTDADTDPTGEKGTQAAETKAAEAKRKAAEKAEADKK